MNKKIALVTGGTSGVGLSIAKALAKEQYEVNFIGTTALAGKKIETELKAEFGNEHIKFHQVNLASINDTKQFVMSFQSNHSKLDLLANVAGVLLPTRQESLEGIEKTFAIGYLSAFYMTNELIPLLKKGKSPRIVNVGASPSVILKEQLNFSDLNSRIHYNGFKASIQAVHAKTVFTQTLSNKLKDSDISVNSFHPGNIKSGLFRNMPIFLKLTMKLFSPLFKQESKIGTYVCLDVSIENITGKLISDKKPIDLVFENDYQQQLWQESERLIRQALTAKEKANEKPQF